METTKPIVKRMPHDLFVNIRDGVDALCKRIRPTRHNGRMKDFAHELNNFFIVNHYDQQAYLNEVAARQPSRHS